MPNIGGGGGGVEIFFGGVNILFGGVIANIGGVAPPPPENPSMKYGHVYLQLAFLCYYSSLV